MGHSYEFTKDKIRWDEGIALGNGFLGSLVWWKERTIRLALDRGDIWDTTPCPETQKEEFSYPTMVKLVQEKNLEEIRRIFDGPYNHLIPSKLPVGAIEITMPEGKKKAELKLEQAVMDMQWEKLRLQCFVHAEKKVGLLRLEGPLEAVSWSLEYPKYNTNEGSNLGLANSVDTAALEQLHYPEPEKKEEGSFRYFIQKITPEFSYGIFAGEKVEEKKALIAYTVAASVDGKDWIEKAQESVKRTLQEGFEENLIEHENWWKDFWDKSGIQLPDAFVEKNWYMANYLLASGSRKGGYPMPLQGLWTADDGKLPPWKGDYHHDLNTELSYYHYLKANHLEEGECFLDYLWKLREQGQRFAKDFYHAKGACIPATMTLDGQPLGGWGMYSLSPVMSIWLCQMFERYYLYTGDEDFLRERVYPYMQDTGCFIESLLEEREGRLYLPISSSPEIHDDELEAFLMPNSNFDLSLMRYLYRKLTDYAVKLGNGEEKQWEMIYKKLPQLAVNDKKVLMLSPEESLKESHRHLSHLMAIHPLRLLDYENPEDRIVIQESIKDLEQLGKGAWVGYSFGWMAQLYAVAKNGNGAAYSLKTFWESFCSDNGFHLNGDFKNRGITASHYRPFTLEGNMCAADALQEMLLFSENGKLELFPAIPDEWLEDRTAFHHFRGEKGCLITAACKNGRLESLEIQFTRDTKLFLRKNRFTEGICMGEAAKEEETGYWISGRAGEVMQYI